MLNILARVYLFCFVCCHVKLKVVLSVLNVVSSVGIYVCFEEFCVKTKRLVGAKLDIEKRTPKFIECVCACYWLETHVEYSRARRET